MSSSDRIKLEELESQLIRCLLCSAPPPEGIDQKKATEAGKALSLKRKRAIARTLERQLNKLGDENFQSSFGAFILKHPGVHKDGPGADTAAFLNFISGTPVSRIRRLLSNFAEQQGPASCH